MKLIATLALAFTFAIPSFGEGGRTPIGSLPLKSGSVMVVQEYLSKARLPEKVVIVSPFEEVYAFRSGKVTKILEIDNRYSVFVKDGDYFYIYNNVYALAVNEGEYLQEGELLGSLRYDDRYGEYQMEMQIWRDNGQNTCRRLVNDHVVCILSGKPYIPKVAKPKAKKPSSRSKYAKSRSSKGKSKYAKSSRSKSSGKKYASKSKYNKKKTVARKKPVAKKKTVAKKKR